MKKPILSLLAGCLLWSPISHAAAIYSNLSTPTPVSGEIVGQDPPSTYEIADAFVPSQNYQLTLGIATVRRETGAAVLTANIWSNASGSPGMLLATASVSAASVPTSISNVTFSFPGGVTLSANATYWFSLTSTSNTQYNWTSNTAATYPEKYRINSGAWNGPTSPMSTFEVDGVVVLEPSTWLTVFAGTVMLGATLRRRGQAVREFLA